MRRVTWLHLSDLHFKAETGVDEHNRNVVLDALMDDVRHRADKIAPELSDLDFVVVSGDVAFSGQPGEYALAVNQLVQPIMGAAGLSDRSDERLFIVPGNHDIDRHAISEEAQQTQDGISGRDDVNRVLLDDNQSSLLLKRHAAFDCFFASQFPKIKTQYPGGFYVTSLQSQHDVKVTILGLNSAWLAAGSSKDFGRLALGEVQVERALLAAGSDKGLCIALIHHPLEWFLEEDRAAVDVLLSRHCHIILRGHMHKSDVVSRRTLFGDILEIPCGTLYGTRGYGNGYNYASVDTESGKATIYLRRWSDERREWVKDIDRSGDSLGGTVTRDLPSSLLDSATAKPSVADRVRQAANGVPSSSSGWRRIDGVRPQTTPERTIGRDATISKLVSLVEREHVVNIVGLPGVGKSTIASMYAARTEVLGGDQKQRVVWLNLSEATGLSDIVGTVLESVGDAVPDLAGHSSVSLARVLVQILRERALLLVLDQADILLSQRNDIGSNLWIASLLNSLLQDTSPSKIVLVTPTPVRTPSGLSPATFEIKGLELDDSIALLQEHGATGNRAALQEAALRTAGHPLSLILVAQAAQSVKTVDALLSDRNLWKGHGQSIARRVLGPVMANSISASEKLVLESLSVLRHPSPIELVAAITGIPPTRHAELAEAALELAAKSLLNSDRSLYWLHPIVQTYVEANAVDSDGLHSGAAHFFAGLAYAARGKPDEQIGWLLESLNHAERAGRLRLSTSIVQSLSGALFDSGAAAVVGQFASRLLLQDDRKHELPARDRVGLLIIHGRSLRYVGKTDQALRVYKQAEECARRNGQLNVAAHALSLAGAAELSRHQYDMAVRRSSGAADMARAAHDRPIEANSLGNRGIALMRLCRFDDAEEQVLKALSIMRDINDYHGQSTQLAALSTIEQERGDITACEGYLLESLRIADLHGLPIHKARAIANLGNLYATMHLPMWAIEQYKKALRIWRSMPWPEEAANILAAYGATLYKSGCIRGALVCALEAMQLASLRPNTEEGVVSQAKYLIDRIKSTLSERYLSLVAEIGGDPLRELDQLLAAPTPRIGLLVLSEETHERIEYPDDPSQWNDIAAMYIKEDGDKRSKPAEELLRAAIDCEPGQWASYFNLAQLLSDRGRSGEAEWFYRKALGLQPGDTDILLGLGRLLATNGRWQESVKSLRPIPEKRPDSVDALRVFALALSNADQWAEAVTVYRRLIDLEPEKCAHRLELAIALRNTRQGKEALEHIELVLSEDPWNVRALAEKCWGMGEADQLDEATNLGVCPIFRSELGASGNREDQVI